MYYNTKKDLMTVRNVDDKVFRMFKTKAAEHKMKMGKALTEAITMSDPN
jgi:plasmid stability protein